MVLSCTAQETSFRVKDSGAGYSADQVKGLLVHWTEVGPALLVVNLTLKLATFCPLWFSEVCLYQQMPQPGFDPCVWFETEG